MRSAIFLVTALLGGQSAVDGQLLRSSVAPAVFPGDSCADGIAYDDGVFENGYGFNSSALFGSYVMRFALPSSASKIKAVCICMQSLGGSTVEPIVDVYAADGSGGGPNTLLDSESAGLLTGLTAAGKWFRVEMADEVTVGSTVFAGVTWSPLASPNKFVCADESGPGGQPAYGGATIFAPTGLVSTTFPQYRALGVRLVVEEATCLPSQEALCLNKGRFKVQAAFQVGTQVTNAKVVKLTDETGYLWFFNQSNVEAVVKVLDACALNGKYWVFAGGLTNVRVDLTVTDTETGNFKTYQNPQGAAFQPIQDTAALPCN